MTWAPKVERVETDEVTDLSGVWNDTASRLVSEEMILDCLNHPWLGEFMRDASKKPTVIVGSIRNKTQEHIPVGTFVNDIERAFVVHGEPGWDEATPVGEFVLFDVRGGRVERTLRTPEDYGLSRCAPEDLAGGDAAHNAQELTRVFTGEDRGPHRDALVMSTSLVLEVQGTAGDAMHGVELANAALDEGNAADLLTRLRTHFDNR